MHNHECLDIHVKYTKTKHIYVLLESRHSEIPCSLATDHYSLCYQLAPHGGTARVLVLMSYWASVILTER